MLSTGRVELDPEGRQSCLDAITRFGPECTRNGGNEFGFDRACEEEDLTNGLQAVDEACERDLECEPDLYCGSGDDGDRCRQRPGEGEPCPERACAEGLWCGKDELCEPDPVPGLGDGCVLIDRGEVIEDNCERGLVCGPDEVCIERQATGAECSRHAECASWLCEEGLCVRGDSDLYCDFGERF